MAKILLGVTGCIAVYKAADLASALVSKGLDVKVIMTEAAKKFITPLTMATMSQHPVYDDSVEWAVGPDPTVKHVELAKWCDLFVVCPATANTIAKMAHGMADNLLTSTYLALPKSAKVLVCPAMNTAMWEAQITINNVRTLTERNHSSFYPAHYTMNPVLGKLACGDMGMGKLPKVPDIVGFIIDLLSGKGVPNAQV